MSLLDYNKKFAGILLFVLINGCNLLTNLSGEEDSEDETSLEKVTSEKTDGSAGTEVTYPNGVLPADIVISIEEGDNLVKDTVIAILEISGTATAKTSAVNMSANQDLSDEVVTQIEIGIPYEGQLEDYFVVFYHVKKEDGKFYYGIIPTDQISQVDGFIRFKAIGVGNYQVVLVSDRITEDPSKETSSAPTPESQAENSIAPSNAVIAISSSGNETYTQTTSVSLALSATDASEMYVTNSSNCADGGSWETYSTSKSWTLAPLDQTATVYAKFRSSDGTESSCVSDSIIHDATAPTTVSVTDGSFSSELTQSPTISWTSSSDAGSGVKEYYVAIGTTAGGNDIYEWTSVGNVTSTTLSGLSLSSNSTYYASVKAADAAGNQSAASQGDGWTVTYYSQQAYVKTSNTLANRQLGNRVAIDGDTVVVSAYYDDSNQTTITSGTGASTDSSSSDSGAVHVFKRTGSVWAQEAYIKAVNNSASDNFGYSLDLSGNILVVGAWNESSNETTVTNGTTASTNDTVSKSGAAYVYVRSGMTWTQQAYLKAVNADSNDRFGASVGVSGDTIVVGAYDEDSNQSTITNGATASADWNSSNSGAAYVYVQSGTSWTQQAYLKASNNGSSDVFGTTVAISSDTITVGAPSESSSQTTITNGTAASADDSAVGTGAVYVFVRSGTSWTQQAYIKPPTTGADSFSVYDGLDIDSDTMVVGSVFEDSNQTTITNGTTASSDNSASSSGAAYVYKRTGSTWIQEAFLKASNSDSNDNFGHSVSVSGDVIAVGAQAEDSNQTTITNGSMASSDNSLASTGAVYVFRRSGSQWSQSAYLKPAAARLNDSFGSAVDVSQGVIVVGVPQDDSNQSTITNGTTASSDTSKNASGAAYIFSP